MCSIDAFKCNHGFFGLKILWGQDSNLWITPKSDTAFQMSKPPSQKQTLVKCENYKTYVKYRKNFFYSMPVEKSESPPEFPLNVIHSSSKMSFLMASFFILCIFTALQKMLGKFTSLKIFSSLFIYFISSQCIPRFLKAHYFIISKRQ